MKKIDPKMISLLTDHSRTSLGSFPTKLEESSALFPHFPFTPEPTSVSVASKRQGDGGYCGGSASLLGRGSPLPSVDQPGVPEQMDPSLTPSTTILHTATREVF